MIQVNELIQMCNEMVGVVSHEESLEGGLAEVSVQQLNLLISELNGQGYLSMTQNYIDHANTMNVYFKELTDAERVNTTDITSRFRTIRTVSAVRSEGSDLTDGLSKAFASSFPRSCRSTLSMTLSTCQTFTTTC